MDDRLAAEEDPVRFLRAHTQSGVIIDETQKVPALFSYLQGIVDESGTMGRYVLTGSQNFLLLENITQSLAGRVAISYLMPFSMPELERAGRLPDNLDDVLFTGMYPVLYDRKVSPTDYFPSYIQTYIECDVRSITNVGDLSMFQRFVKLCAGRVGQLLNLSGIGTELGINYKTVRSWISILQASFIVFLLTPHHRNFNLRFHAGRRSNAYFWRDNAGHEIDLLLEEGTALRAVEIKSGETLHEDFFRGLQYFKRISGQPDEHFFLVYGGTRCQTRKHGHVLGWRHIADLLQA